MDPATWKVILEAGNLGLVLVLLVRVLPWMQNRFDKISSEHLKSYKEESQADRAVFSKQIRRLSVAMSRAQADARNASKEELALLLDVVKSLKEEIRSNTQATIRHSEIVRDISCLKEAPDERPDVTDHHCESQRDR